MSIGTVSEQLVYEILDPGSYLTADVTADFTGVTLEEVGPDRVRITGGTGRERPATLKVNMGYRAGFVGEAQFTYTWPDAYAKAQRGLAFLRKRLERADFRYTEDIVEYLGHTSMWGSRVPAPDDPDLLELVVRYAARCPDATEARKVFTESVPLYNNGPAGVAGVGTRPPLKELYAHLALPGTARARRTAGGDARTGYGGRAMRVADLAHGRSGDKGDTCNVGIVA